MDSGIYKIANKVTRDYYIGSSVDINKRFIRHKTDLKHNNHGNIYLQRIHNKYGIDNLSFEIIEYVGNKNNLIAREQYYFDILKPEYNLQKIAGSNLGYKPSAETRKKISKALKGRKGHPCSEKTKRKFSELYKGKKLSATHISNRTQAQSKPFRIISPQGKLIEGKNLHKFCRENNLDSSSMHKVMLGKYGYKSYKGWTKGE